MFTVDKPVIFNFHGYPWLIHRLAYRRRNHANIHVRGYKEKGNINTPLELAINNNIDRLTLAMDAIKRTPKLQKIGGHAMEKFRNLQIDCRNYAYEHGIDKPEVAGWSWPYYVLATCAPGMAAWQDTRGPDSRRSCDSAFVSADIEIKLGLAAPAPTRG